MISYLRALFYQTVDDIDRRTSKRLTQNTNVFAIDSLISSNLEHLSPKLTVKTIPGKGTGVFANENYTKDLFVIEYTGILISDPSVLKQLNSRDKMESASYILYFRFKNKAFAIDATTDDGSLGRLINCSHKNPNLKPVVHQIDHQPRVFFQTLTVIKRGEELVWDYNLSSQERKDHPWYSSS